MKKNKIELHLAFRVPTTEYDLSKNRVLDHVHFLKKLITLAEFSEITCFRKNTLGLLFFLKFNIADALGKFSHKWHHITKLH